MIVDETQSMHCYSMMFEHNHQHPPTNSTQDKNIKEHKF